MSNSSYTLRIKIDEKYRSNDKFVKYYQDKVHTGTYYGDSGVDLCMPFDYTAKCTGVNVCNLGISCELVDNCGKNVDMAMFPRSSISSTPLQLVESCQFIKSTCRDELVAYFICWPDKRHQSTITSNNYTIQEGTRLLQITSPDLKPIKVEIVDELSHPSHLPAHILRIKIDDQYKSNQKMIEYYQYIVDNCDSSESCINICMPTSYLLENQTVTKCGLGISCEMIDCNTGKNIGYYMNANYAILPETVHLANNVGIIDAGYRGEMIAMFRHQSNDTDSPTINIGAGSSVIRICTPDLYPMRVELVDTLSESDRGTNGIGSTGTK